MNELFANGWTSTFEEVTIFWNGYDILKEK